MLGAGKAEAKFKRVRRKIMPKNDHAFFLKGIPQTTLKRGKVFNELSNTIKKTYSKLCY